MCASECSIVCGGGDDSGQFSVVEKKSIDIFLCINQYLPL